MRKGRLVIRQTSPLSSATLTLAEPSDGNCGLIQQFGDVIVPVASKWNRPSSLCWTPTRVRRRRISNRLSRTTAERQGAVYSAAKGQCRRGLVRNGPHESVQGWGTGAPRVLCSWCYSTPEPTHQIGPKLPGDLAWEIENETSDRVKLGKAATWPSVQTLRRRWVFPHPFSPSFNTC